MGIVFKILRSTIFITLFTILEYSYYLLDNVVTNSLSLINAFQCVFHHLKITIVVREGENETHAFNGEFHEKMEVQIGLVMKKSWQNTFVLLWSSAPIVKISNPKEISFEFLHFCPLVRSDEIALLYASLNNISLQPFLLSLLYMDPSFSLYTFLKQRLILSSLCFKLIKSLVLNISARRLNYPK